MKKTILIIIIVIPIIFMLVQNSLTYKLNRLIKNKDCISGVSVIGDNKIWTIGNEKQPLLSVFKIFVALNVLSDEKINLDTKLKIDKSKITANTYSPMLKKYTKYPFEISIKELLEYMVSQSDNNACDVLLDYIGGAHMLEKYIHNLGFNEVEISVNEREMTLDINKQYLNKAYNKDVAKIIKLAHEGKILSKEKTQFFDEIMIKTTTGESKLKAGLPQSVVLGHKTGSSSRKKNGEKIAENDAGFVILQNGQTYYISVMLTNSKKSDEKNAEIISEISKIVYDYMAK